MNTAEQFRHIRAADALHLLQYSRHITDNQRAAIERTPNSFQTVLVYRRLLAAQELTEDERQAIPLLRAAIRGGE